MISTRSAGLVIDTLVCLTLAKWETVSGRFGGYLNGPTGEALKEPSAFCPSRLGLSDQLCMNRLAGNGAEVGSQWPDMAPAEFL